MITRINQFQNELKKKKLLGYKWIYYTKNIYICDCPEQYNFKTPRKNVFNFDILEKRNKLR